MRPWSWQTILCWAALCGCSGPSLDLPGAGPAPARVELIPAASVDAVPTLFRARLRQAPAGGEPWLFRGELSDYYHRAVARGELSSALRERALTLRYWRDQADCWLQPVDWLEPDETYTLAFGGVGRLQVLHTQSGGERRASRLFPPAGSSKHQVAVLCDAGEGVDELDTELTLEPGGVPLLARSGMAGLALPGCVTLSAKRLFSEAAVSPPNWGAALLEPSAWLPLPQALAERSCPGTRSHGACLEALDDRIVVTPDVSDQLWVLDGQPPVAARALTRATLVRNLSPETGVTLRGSVLSSDGGLNAVALALTTTRARRHVVLNEVLANPLGPEASGEWIELLNDSERSVSLGGLWLEDGSGHAPLPSETLAAGEFAVIVAAGFAPSELDVAMPQGVRQIVVPSLGGRGLSNAGEALALVGEEGILSRFPQLVASHGGRSIARRSADAADDAASSFAEHGGIGASPGAANSFGAAEN